MNKGFLLFRLQTIDSKIDSINNRLTEIALILQNKDLIHKAEEDKISAEQILIAEQKTIEKITDEIEKKRIKKEESESALYSGKVSNPKELQDLESEIQSLKKIIHELEEKAFNQLIVIEEVEKEYKNASTLLQETKSSYETSKSILISEIESLENQRINMEPERDSLRAQLSTTDLKMYEDLRKEKSGLAISILDGDCCSACGAMLTPSQKQEARSAQFLFTCPSCGRIIYGD